MPEDSFAFLVDADFVLVKDFAAKLKTGVPGSLLRYSANAWQERSERHAVIVPAFQREPEEASGSTPQGQNECAPTLEAIKVDSDCWMYNQYDVPLTESALHRMLGDGSITGFYEDKVRCTRPDACVISTKAQHLSASRIGAVPVWCIGNTHVVALVRHRS